jgi:hypothetical protein
MQIGLHHHGEKRLIDPLPALQQRREERAGAQLRDAQVQVPGRRGQCARWGAVALGGARLGALVRRGADRRGQLRRGQRLIQRLGCRADAVIDVGNFSASSNSSRGDWSRRPSRGLSPECSLASSRRRSTLWPLARHTYADELKTTDQLHHFQGRHPAIHSMILGSSVSTRIALAPSPRGGHPEELQGTANLILVLQAHATAHSTAPSARLQNGLERPGDYDVNGRPHFIFGPERLSPAGVERDFRDASNGSSRPLLSPAPQAAE